MGQDKKEEYDRDFSTNTEQEEGWKKLIKEKELLDEEIRDASVSIMENAIIIGTPKYNASLMSLQGILSNEAKQLINMQPAAKVALAIQFGTLFVESMENEIDK